MENGSDRDKNGRFAKGNGGGPGRPRKAREEEYLAILLAECKPDDARTIVASAVSRAKAGDKSAREWLFNYILGKPIERKEISGPDQGPIEVVGVGVTTEDIAEARRILGDAGN